jgi:hypothetical protein
MEVRARLHVGGRVEALEALTARRPYTHLLSLGCPMVDPPSDAAAPVRLAFDELHDEETADLLEVVRVRACSDVAWFQSTGARASCAL